MNTLTSGKSDTTFDYPSSTILLGDGGTASSVTTHNALTTAAYNYDGKAEAGGAEHHGTPQYPPIQLLPAI